MAYLGLRCSEACQLKKNNFAHNCTEIRYKDMKTKVYHQKYLPEFFIVEIQQYIIHYEKTFRDEYMFPPLYQNVSKNSHIKSSTFRHFFKDFRRLYNLNIPYKYAKNGRPLYRISPHTLKHYCLYKIYKASGNDLIFVKQFSGHIEMKHTIRYILHENSRSRQSKILTKAFS